MKGSQCRECRCPIAFVQMLTGKRAPVDPAPDERGTIIARRRGRHYVEGGYSPAAAPTPLGHVRLMSHFGTCGARLPKVRTRPRPADPLF